MKKYLKFLMVAIFATMTFAFVACGNDDDDEPNNGSNSTSSSLTLTLDETKYTFDSGITTFDSDEVLVELFNSNFYPWINFVIYEPYELSNGMVLTPDMEVHGMGPIVLGVINYNNLQAGGYVLKSGSVKINSINLNSKKLQLTFNNAIFEEFVYKKSTVKVNGSLSVSLDAQWGIAGK